MTVKVKNISGLEDYGTSIHRFAGKFEEVSSDTMREFNTNLEGEKAAAINAFFKRLNGIQKSVFSQTPEAIRTYGQHVFTFTGEIKGLGFSSHAHTDEDAINTLTESLKTPQRNLISIVKDEMVALFDEAIEAMGDGDSNLGDFDAKADAYIADEIKARKETHSGIISAHDSLSSGVSGVSTTFESLTKITQNARTVTTLPVQTIIDAIKNNTLTESNMVYLSRITTKEDAQVLQAILSGKLEDVDKIMENDPEKISDGGYMNLAEELTIWMDRSEIGTQKINRLLDAMGKTDQSKVNVFSERLDKQQHISKQIQIAEMYAYEQDPEHDAATMEKHHTKLSQMNDLSGLLTAVRILKIGTKVEGNPGVQFRNDDPFDPNAKLRYTRKEIFITLNDAVNPEWELHVKESKKSIYHYGSKTVPDYDELSVPAKTTLETYTSHHEKGIDGALAGKYEAELYKIKKEHEKADAEFQETIVKEGIKTILTYIGGPAAAATFSVADSLSQLHATDSIKNTHEMLDEMTSGRANAFIKKIGNYGGKSANEVLAGFFKLQSKVAEFKAKTKNEQNNIYNVLVGQGGWQLNHEVAGPSIEAIAQSSSIYADYGAYQRVQELNQKGVMGYFESIGLRDSAYQEIQKYFQNDPAMQNFLLGEHTNGEGLTIENMTPEQIQTIPYIVNKVKGDSSLSDFLTYFEKQYGK